MVRWLGELDGAVLAVLRAMFVVPMCTRLLASWRTPGIPAWEGISINARVRCRLRDVHIPPAIKFCGGGLPFRRLIDFEKVDDEFVQFLVVKSIVINCPVGGVGEGKVELGERSL